MANSPIQIVLNSNDFIKVWERTPGGGHKDFYEGHDKEFVEHKVKLSNQLSLIRDKQYENQYSKISYAKVLLKQNALAKSHRPTSSIFKKDIAPVVGAGDLGEIFVELNPTAIEIINRKIETAEAKTQWKEDAKGKQKANPSIMRSEVGAIAEIIPYSSSDKRKFSLNEAINWLKNPKTAGAYIIELFYMLPPKQQWDLYDLEKIKLFKSFEESIKALGEDITLRRYQGNKARNTLLSIRIEKMAKTGGDKLSKSTIGEDVNLDEVRHAKLLDFLDNHPLVKKISLPPIITQTNDSNSVSNIGIKHKMPEPKTGHIYPKVGVIDGGISGILDEWAELRYGFLGPADKDLAHGSFIAGLLVSSNTLNGGLVGKEPDGCILIDLDLLPKEGSYEDYYKDEPLAFFDELEQAVRYVKDKTGVRIFNFSLNIQEHVSSDNYSYPAKFLDQIAEENDVIFVISAGNTGPNDFRKEWPSDSVEALKILATAVNDRLKKPAESYRNLSVAALNPPNHEGVLPYSLSNYSCRGPGLRIGLKPDLAHIGGSGTKLEKGGHGLYSIDENGLIVDGCGTSYSAPHVAKSLATLDSLIEGDVSRESLIAMTIHNAMIRELYVKKEFASIATDLIGFGMPLSAADVIDGDENSITLVFANRIFPGMHLSFGFNWPTCLVENGKCLGTAKLTIVSTPPFDYNFGSEFVRVNVEAHLRQDQGNGKFIGKLRPKYLTEHEKVLFEKSLIDQSFKWSPIKVYENSFPKGVGKTTNWRLEIEHLTREGETIPPTGIPFTAILTISDPKKKKPVFNEMRQLLQAIGVQTVDIKTAARIMQRH